jgi:hypothetical protein
MRLKVEEIFVDVDGVLASFYERYRELYSELDHPSKNKEKEYNRSNFSDFIERQEFRNLSPMPDMYEGIEFLYHILAFHHTLPISILGSVGYIDCFETMVEQKMYWLRKHDIHFPSIFVAGKKLKKSYAGPGRLLIDDTLVNCQEWGVKGGIAIHHSSWEKTISKLELCYSGVYYHD